MSVYDLLLSVQREISARNIQYTAVCIVKFLNLFSYFCNKSYCSSVNIIIIIPSTFDFSPASCAVQFKTVSSWSGKRTCYRPLLSEVPPVLPFTQFQCLPGL